MGDHTDTNERASTPDRRPTRRARRSLLPLRDRIDRIIAEIRAAEAAAAVERVLRVRVPRAQTLAVVEALLVETRDAGANAYVAFVRLRAWAEHLEQQRERLRN